MIGISNKDVETLLATFLNKLISLKMQLSMVMKEKQVKRVDSSFREQWNLKDQMMLVT